MKDQQPSKKPATQHHRPHCRSCGGSEIDFTYTEMDFGHEIDESNALEMACYYLADVLRGEIEGDSDPVQIQGMATTMARLAAMRRVRKPADGASETAEAQS